MSSAGAAAPLSLCLTDVPSPFFIDQHADTHEMAIPAEGGSPSAAVYHSIPNADVDRDGPLPEGSGNGNGNGEQQVLIQKEGG